MIQIQNSIEFLLASLSINPGFVVWGNTLAQYTKTIVLFVILLVVFRVFQFIILKKLQKLAEKTETDIDDTLVEIVRSLKPGFYSFLAFYFAIQFLTLQDIVAKTITAILIIWVFYQIIIAVQILINSLIEKQMKGEEGDETTRSALALVGRFSKGILWAIGILMILSNLGINVSSLVAGLGIGGIAIAFALQNILTDLFSSFAIYFDKPFRVGDFIVVGEHLGVVEKIGIKTTRLRALQGEEIIISNQELTSTRVQNFKKMEKRRIVFSFGITYQTPIEKVRKIPETVKNIITGIGLANFDRAHFKSFGDSALLFEVVYSVKSSEYADYMNTQQEINLTLAESFGKEGIEFAYPTQTIFLERNT